jgi:hypothetical protein
MAEFPVLIGPISAAEDPQKKVQESELGLPKRMLTG